jgi:cytochrome d ubiquinol oxidase subunit I
MIDGTHAARLIFGSGMIFHQLLTGALNGMALVLLLLAMFSAFSKNLQLQFFLTLWIRLYSIQLAIAVASGISLQTGLSENWPGASQVLLPLVNHPFGRSALIGFMVASGAAIILLASDKARHPFITLLIALIIFASTWFMNSWSVVVNSAMQTPVGLEIFEKNGYPVSTNISDLHAFIFNPSMCFKMMHQQISSCIQGLIFLVLVMAFLNQKPQYTLPRRLQGGFMAILMILLFLQPIIGHQQYAVVRKYQTPKAAALEGYYKAEDGFHVYILGTTNSGNLQTTGIHLPSDMEKTLMSSLKPSLPLQQIPVSKWPSVERVFYSFHTMLVCWATITLGICYMLCVVAANKELKLGHFYLLTVLFGFSVIAGLAGWIVSEAGRQPWIIYGLLETERAATNVTTLPLILSLSSNIVLPLALSYLWIKLQLKEINRSADGT